MSTSTLKIVVDPKAAKTGSDKAKAAIQRMSSSATKNVADMHKAFMQLGSSITDFADKSKRVLKDFYAKGVDSLSKLSHKMSKLTGFAKKLTHAFGGFFKSLAQVALVTAFLREMIKVNNIYTSFISTMHIVTHDIDASKEKWKYLIGVADKLGVQVQGLAEPFGRLSAALIGVDENGIITKQLFESISIAAVVLHKSAFDTNLMFKAIEQTASKGRVQLEELQKQLSQQLPGAMRLAAIGWQRLKNVMAGTPDVAINTGAALAKFYASVADGSAKVKDVLLGLSQEIKLEMGGSVEFASHQFVAAMGRINNAILKFFVDVGQSGAMDGLIKVVNAITKTFEKLTPAAESLGQFLNKVFTDLASVIASITPTQAVDMFNSLLDALKKAYLVIVNISKSMVKLYGNSDTLKTNMAIIGNTLAFILTVTYKITLGFMAIVKVVKHIAHAILVTLYGSLKLLTLGLSKTINGLLDANVRGVNDTARELANIFTAMGKDLNINTVTATDQIKKNLAAASHHAKDIKDSSSKQDLAGGIIKPLNNSELKGALASKSNKVVSMDTAHMTKFDSITNALAVRFSRANDKLEKFKVGVSTSSTAVNDLNTVIQQLNNTSSEQNHKLAESLKAFASMAEGTDKATASLKNLKAERAAFARLRKLDSRSTNSKYHTLSDAKIEVSTGSLRNSSQTVKNRFVNEATNLDVKQRFSGMRDMNTKSNLMIESIKAQTDSLKSGLQVSRKKIALDRLNVATTSLLTGALVEQQPAINSLADDIEARLIKAYDDLSAAQAKVKGDQFIKDSKSTQQGTESSINSDRVALGQMSQFNADRASANADLASQTTAETDRFNALSDSQKAREDLTAQHHATLESLQTAHKARMGVISKQETEGRVQAVSTMFGNLSSLMQSHSRKAFEVGKAAATAQAIIDTISGAQKAFTALVGLGPAGPFLGAAAAAAALAAGYMRVQKIQATQFNSKSASGGSGGASSASAPSNISVGSNKAASLGSSLGGSAAATTASNITNHIVVNATNATPGIINMINQGVQTAVSQSYAAVLQDTQTNGPIRQTLAA